MKKLIITFSALFFSSYLLAEEAQWFETTKDSHIFIKRHNITTDKNNPDLKTVIMSVNIPSIQERGADPEKTSFANATPISYLTEVTVNCKDKSARIGKQSVYEDFFGKGKLLEQSDEDPNTPFTPINGDDALALWEIACMPDKKD